MQIGTSPLKKEHCKSYYLVFLALTSALWVVMVDPSALAFFPTAIVVHADDSENNPPHNNPQQIMAAADVVENLERSMFGIIIDTARLRVMQNVCLQQ